MHFELKTSCFALICTEYMYIRYLHSMYACFFVVFFCLQDLIRFHHICVLNLQLGTAQSCMCKDCLNKRVSLVIFAAMLRTCDIDNSKSLGSFVLLLMR